MNEMKQGIILTVDKEKIFLCRKSKWHPFASEIKIIYV